MKKVDKSRIWITWDDHPRSRTLSYQFGADYIVLDYNGIWVFRYFFLTIRTAYLISRISPDLVFCQNPSLILNFCLCFLKKIYRFRLIADRHTNFAFRHAKSYRLKWILYRVVSNFTIRHSDLTIVTNDFLKKYVECSGGNSAVLPDMLPAIEVPKSLKDGGDFCKGFSFLFVCTFSDDEPYAEVIEAAQTLPGEDRIYISGNYHKGNGISSCPYKNVVFLGFVNDDDYFRYMKSVDAVIVLTSLDYTLNCGAYEAVSLGKPMILSDTETIRNYFEKGCIYTDLSASGIAHSLAMCKENVSRLNCEVRDLREKLSSDWFTSFEYVNKKIDQLCLC